MNEVIVPGRTTPATSTVHPQDVGKLIGKLLEASPVIRETEKWRRGTLQEWSEFIADHDGESGARRALRAVNRQYVAETQERARRVLSTIPPGRVIEDWRVKLQPKAVPATIKQGTILLALLHDVFRVKEGESADVRASAALYVLADRDDGSLPPACVLAAAADDALRSLKFSPAPSEMLELCRQANSKFSGAIDTVERLDEIRHEAAIIADAAPGEALVVPYARRPRLRMWKPQLPAKPDDDPYRGAMV